MKARKFLLAGLTAGLALTVASCGGGNRSANYEVPEGGFDKEQKMTIKFYHTMGDTLQNELQSAVAAFEKDYPNVKIDHTQVGGYDDVRNQIITQIPQNNEPHIAYCYPDHVALYNKANAVVQLDNLINDPTYGFTKEQLADFVPGYYEEGKQYGDDKMYTLPFSKSTEVLYYNATEFKKNGWEVPTTWQDMMALCETIKLAKNKDNSEMYPNVIPLGLDSEANLFIELCEQTGSPYTSATENHYLFDNEKNRSMVEEFVTWHQAGLFTTKQVLDGAYTSSLFVNLDRSKPFSLMSIGSTGGASNQYPNGDAFEVGVAPIPVWDGGELKVISQGPSLCLFNKADPQEVLASWIFVKDYLLQADFQAQFSRASGYNPVIKSAVNGILYGLGASGEDMTYQQWLDEGTGSSKEGLKALTAKVSTSLTDNYFTSPAFVGSSTARDQVGSLFVAAITKSKSVSQAFRDAILECED